MTNDKSEERKISTSEREMSKDSQHAAHVIAYATVACLKGAAEFNLINK